MPRRSAKTPVLAKPSKGNGKVAKRLALPVGRRLQRTPVLQVSRGAPSSSLAVRQLADNTPGVHVERPLSLVPATPSGIPGYTTVPSIANVGGDHLRRKGDTEAGRTAGVGCVIRSELPAVASASKNVAWSALTGNCALALVDVNPRSNAEYYIRDLTSAVLSFATSATWDSRSVAPQLDVDAPLRTNAARLKIGYTGNILNMQGWLYVIRTPPIPGSADLNAFIETAKYSPASQRIPIGEIYNHGLTLYFTEEGNAARDFVRTDANLPVPVYTESNVDQSIAGLRHGWNMFILVGVGLDANANFSIELEVAKEVRTLPGTIEYAMSSPAPLRDGVLPMTYAAIARRQAITGTL